MKKNTKRHIAIPVASKVKGRLPTLCRPNTGYAANVFMSSVPVNATHSKAYGLTLCKTCEKYATGIDTTAWNEAWHNLYGENPCASVSV